jgi:hypothetical protein
MWNSMTSAQPPSIEDAKAYDQRFVGIMAATSLGVMGLFWKRVFRKDSIYLALLIAAIALGIAYPGVIKRLPQLIHLLSGDNSTTGGLILLAVVAALGTLAFWARRRKFPLVHLFAMSVLLVVLGFSTYTMILIRANKHTPMNENEPRTFVIKCSICLPGICSLTLPDALRATRMRTGPRRNCSASRCWWACSGSTGIFEKTGKWQRCSSFSSF